MREKDIKILWGRSGNRCAICKIELTTEGDIETLGEMAHIVGRSSDGPRGDSDLNTKQRNDYSNLILLCPTHHTEIDKCPKNWPIEKLHETKERHEKWVSTQLEQGNISIRKIDNIFFLKKRINEYIASSNGKTWLVISITPLNISGDIIDPRENEFIKTINEIRLPPELSRNSSVNRYHTRPNENGLINDDMQNLKKGEAHKVQIFRNGHCEFQICLESSIKQVTEAERESDPEIVKEMRVIRYTDLAECITLQVKELMNIWQKCLPFTNMSMNAHIINTKHTILFSKERSMQSALYGYPVESEYLEIKNIINHDIVPQEASDILIKDFVSYFGLNINTIRTQTAEFIRPERLM